jgi:hypothetical protein
MSPTSDRDSYIELLDEVMSWLTGLGLIMFVIFPLALPLVALTLLLAIPLLLAAIPLAILAAPMLLIRRALRPRRRERLTRVRVTERGGGESRGYRSADRVGRHAEVAEQLTGRAARFLGQAEHQMLAAQKIVAEVHRSGEGDGDRKTSGYRQPAQHVLAALPAVPHPA